MIQTIKEYIKNLESERDIRVLLAVESGSRSWGFPSADSDYDVRLIYAHRPEWYFHVTNHKDTIEYMSPDRMFDLSGWDLRKSLRLMAKTNPGMTDWLFTDIVYKADDEFLYEIRNLHDRYFNPVRAGYHYISLARNFVDTVSESKDLTFKKYLYFLRAILNTVYVHTFEKHPPVRFQQLMQAVNLPNGIRELINMLIENKSTGCESDTQFVDYALVEYALDQYEKISCAQSSFKPTWSYPTEELKPLDELATKFIQKA